MLWKGYGNGKGNLMRRATRWVLYDAWHGEPSAGLLKHLGRENVPGLAAIR